jgi:hypothetical protein
LSNNPVSASFGLLNFTGLFNQTNFTSNIAQHVASNYLVTPGGGIVTPAKSLAFDVSKAGAASYKIFSGTIETAAGINSKFASVVAKSQESKPPSLLHSVEIKEAITKMFYAAPLIGMLGK